MESKEETRGRILKAADARFEHYGYNKTTMAEVAGDCGMSAANIYRFYESKKEIVAELAACFFSETENAYREAIRKDGLSPAKKLEVFTLEVVHHNYALCTRSQKFIEAVEFVKSERKDMVERHVDVKRSLVAEILAQGNASGDFIIKDVVRSADIFLKAMIFLKSTDSCQLSQKELQRMALDILEMLLNGLLKR